jgi:hypothetical protein
MSQVEQQNDVPAEVEDEGWTRGKASVSVLSPAVRIGPDEIACCYANPLSLRECNANARRIAACLNAFARMTTRGIERLTPEAVETALLKHEMRERRLAELEETLKLAMAETRDFVHHCENLFPETESEQIDATPAVDAANTQQM